MNLPKAIEILTDWNKAISRTEYPDLFDAQKLGIEALDRVQLHRTDRRYPFNTPLPSETEE